MANGKNPKSTKKERKWKPNTGQVGIADWTAADGTLVLRAIEAVSRTGGALRFGYTRDGGAYSIGVYGDGDPYTVYVKPNEEINDVIRDLAATFED